MPVVSDAGGGLRGCSADGDRPVPVAAARGWDLALQRDQPKCRDVLEQGNAGERLRGALSERHLETFKPPSLRSTPGDTAQRHHRSMRYSIMSEGDGGDVQCDEQRVAEVHSPEALITIGEEAVDPIDRDGDVAGCGPSPYSRSRQPLTSRTRSARSATVRPHTSAVRATAKPANSTH
ncbi:hypothetical protein GCM10010187_32810 [Actinomadura coerulea]|nr:hypothetical protein GCM10010187_32810 [Actinomadura coerulea]